MDDLRIGSVVRSVRRRMRLRQVDIGARAGVSQQEVSLLERHGLGLVELTTARRICGALEIRLDVVPRWRGTDLDRLLDEAHARIVDLTVGRLRDAGWETVVEWSFNHFGERGAVDIVAWRPASGHLLVVEVKSDLVDVQDTIGKLDRKARLTAELLPEERGWKVLSISRLLVVSGTTAARDAVRRHGLTFEAAFPVRGREAAAWLRHPSSPIRGLLFVRVTSPMRATYPGPRRIRRSATDRAAGTSPAGAARH